MLRWHKYMLRWHKYMNNIFRCTCRMGMFQGLRKTRLQVAADLSASKANESVCKPNASKPNASKPNADHKNHEPIVSKIIHCKYDFKIIIFTYLHHFAAGFGQMHLL